MIALSLVSEPSSLVSDSVRATIRYVEESETIVLRFKTGYVPIEVFTMTMDEIEAFAKSSPVTKMVFDKSNLTVFHQPSMEWYYVVWKQRMLQFGLKTYRKILPGDKLFRQSVQIGREKIKKNNPDFDFNQFDIQYCSSIEEALAI